MAGMIYGGMRIVESSAIVPQPVLQIRSDFEWITDDVRAEVNAYLLETFGKREQMYSFNGAVFVSPETMRRLRLEASRNAAFVPTFR